MVLSKGQGMIRDRTYCIRRYGADELAELVARAGFGSVKVHSDASVLNHAEDVGCMNRRLVVAARKP